ncbi:MAG TPA: CcmD family protein [Candidatus Acidoferrales bacterium]|jgi:CcmD family protein|nr:CcmD family protein [Candidatus Acidoferrales bacterium]
MKNFESLFAAWMVVWAVFFLYEVTVAQRMSKLQDEIEQLKRQLRGG